MFIAFEGGEGAGKSTQVRRLVQALDDDAGYPVTVTHEPGATAPGYRLRELLADPTVTLPPKAEALLYLADRAVHVEQTIRPALDAGRIVVSDRYADSTIAYQGRGRGLGMVRMSSLSWWAAGGLEPDLTIVLDLDPRIGLFRVRKRGPADRMELESLVFHRRVRDAFLTLAELGNSEHPGGPAPYLVLDAARPVDVVAAEIMSAVTERLHARADAYVRTPR